MTTAEIGKQLVELCRKGENQEAITRFYDPNIVTIEGFDMPNSPRVAKGIDEARKKGKWWADNHTIHSAKAEGPFVSVDKFSVVWDYDVTFKPANKRVRMYEVAVYTVAKDKITHVEFLYDHNMSM